MLSCAFYCAMANAQPLRSLRGDSNNGGHVWIAAHRGDFTFAPENSIAAMEDAIHFGAEIIETDVRLTKDGELIIMHDATVDRTTNGSGRVCDRTLEELKQLRLKTNYGNTTPYPIPTLQEFIRAANGRVYLYLDKVGINLPGHERGYLVRRVLNLLRQENALESAIFVLDWPYPMAREIFGAALERVIFCPVIDDKMPNPEAHVNEYLRHLSPVAFQFRFHTTDSAAFQLLPRVLDSGAKAFVAATWEHHTANHGDRTSLLSHPDAGWGWLLKHGFSIIETNCTRDLSRYLQIRPSAHEAR